MTENPEEISERIANLESKLESSNIDELNSEIQNFQQQVENELAEESEEAEETEQAIKQTEEETGDAENQGNPDELEDAADKEEKILEMLKHQEDLVKDEIQKLEQELQELQQISYDLEEINKEGIEILEQIREDLDAIEAKFRENTTNPNKSVIKQNFNDLEELLKDIREISEILYNYMQNEELLYKEYMEFGKEALKLENNTAELAQEMGEDEKEVEELVRFSKQIRDKNAYQESEQEIEWTEELEQMWAKEETEEEKIARKMEEEVEDSEIILDEDEKIVELSEAIYQDLDELEQFMIQQQDMLKPLFNVKIYKTILGDLKSTKNELKNIIQEERTEMEKLKDEVGETVTAAKRVWDQASKNSKYNFDLGSTKKTGKFLGKWIIYAIIAFVVVGGLALLTL